MSAQPDLPLQLARASLLFAQEQAQAFSGYAMNSLVVITRPAVANFDEDTREYTPPASVVIYDDPAAPGAGAMAGITVAGGQVSYNVGDETTYYDTITAHIPATASRQPQIDDVVTVKDNPDDAMIGRQFRVTDVPTGGRINVSIGLSCVGIAPSRQWGPQT